MDDATTDAPAAEAVEGLPLGSEILALALHRLYGLPMMAEHEYGMHGRRTVKGGLVRAWVRLPDGRALDANGPQAMFAPTEGGDPDDPWVREYRITDLPARIDRWASPADLGSAGMAPAIAWIREHLAGTLSSLGLEPLAQPAGPSAP